MAINVNDPLYPDARPDPVGDDHLEKSDGSIVSNVVGYTHPYLSSGDETTLVNVINLARNFANSANEKEESGQIKEQTINDIVKAGSSTRVPLDMLLFSCDWEQDLTQRNGAQDAEGIGRSLLSYVPQLRQYLEEIL
jgi:hypothetical protein